MAIIDAHIHYSTFHDFDKVASEAGHINTAAHLQACFERNGIEAAVAMGSGEVGLMTLNLNGEFTMDSYNQPDNIFYCVGIHSEELRQIDYQNFLGELEQHLKSPHCAGVKMYPGYNHVYLYDKIHDPIYELAATYQKPVAIHTGDTATSQALLKYSHPLTVDDIAVAHPNTQFVMCHYGNPWIVDATEVAMKNKNVAIDLSGLAQGNFTVDWFWENYKGYVEHLRTWMAYLSSYDRLMYGTDWPLVNIDAYLELMRRIIPEQYHEEVFYQNAKRIYRL